MCRMCICDPCACAQYSQESLRVLLADAEVMSFASDVVDFWIRQAELWHATCLGHPCECTHLIEIGQR